MFHRGSADMGFNGFSPGREHGNMTSPLSHSSVHPSSLHYHQTGASGRLGSSQSQVGRSPSQVIACFVVSLRCATLKA